MLDQGGFSALGSLPQRRWCCFLSVLEKLMTHYGTRSSSSAPLSDEEWRAICDYADEEVRRIRPKNPPAYRATVLARRMEEVISDRNLAAAFAASIAAIPTCDPHDETAVEIDRDHGRALAAMRRGLIEGKRQRAELLERLVAEQARDASWSSAR